MELIEHIKIFIGEAYYWLLIPITLELIAILFIPRVLKQGRSPQGTLAWILLLVLLPFFGAPLYIIFGSRRFHGYVIMRRRGSKLLREPLLVAEQKLQQYAIANSNDFFSHLSGLPWSGGNKLELLKSGEQTFEKIFKAIDEAQKYVLVQFYIVRDDDMGRLLQQKLIAKAKQGVRVYFLSDTIGSIILPSRFVKQMRQAGVEAEFFRSTRRRRSFFQLNFRNHRKLVVVDGEQAFIGGYNIGLEYISKKGAAWRDTHLGVRGPLVAAAQLSFMEDWYWQREQLLSLDWEQKPSGDAAAQLILSGPADERDTCELMILNAIAIAKQRIWFCSPYFVPSSAVCLALIMAASKGIEVRILMPQRSDNRFVDFAAQSFFAELEQSGVQLFLYQQGMLHQKIFLVDDELASVGTANLDPRSFRLNFELTVLVNNKDFAMEVHTMLEQDFAVSKKISREQAEKLSNMSRARLSRLLSPIL